MSKSVADYMATELVSFGPNDDIIAAMRTLLERHLSGAPVLDSGGRVIGILSQKDCLEIVYNTAYHKDWGGQVEQYMNRQVEHIEADCSVLEAAEKFLHSSYRPTGRADQPP
jgi:predicted transcriptional regulator